MATLGALVITTLLTVGSSGVYGNDGELSTTTGDTVLIPCDFGEGTVRNLYWYYNDGTGPVNILTLFKGNVSVGAAYAHRASLHDDSSTLILTDIMLKDEGTYRCDVDREGQTAVPNINTELHVFSLTAETLPEITQCNEVGKSSACNFYTNKSITINCALSNVYPAKDAELVWYRDEQRVHSTDNSKENDDGTFDITGEIEVSESGNLTCYATFLTTQGTVSTAVLVAVTITPEPDIKNAPGNNSKKRNIAIGVVLAVFVLASMAGVIIYFIPRGNRSRCFCKEYTPVPDTELVFARTPTIPTSGANDEFDDILEEIAKALLKKADINKLGKALQFSPADIGRYTDENEKQGNNYMGTLDMLRTWRQGQTTATEREALKSALLRAGLRNLTNRLLSTPSASSSSVTTPPSTVNTTNTTAAATMTNATTSSSTPQAGSNSAHTTPATTTTNSTYNTTAATTTNATPTTSSSTQEAAVTGATATSTTSPSRNAAAAASAPTGKNTARTSPASSANDEFDDILEKIASELFKKTDINTLGKSLGFSPADIGRYIEENERQVGSYMGTLDMLRKWQQRQTPTEEREDLRKALLQADMINLADRLLNTSPSGGVAQSQLSNGMNGETKKHPASNSSFPLSETGKHEGMDRSGKRVVTSEEITKLAKLLRGDNFVQLFNALGFGYSHHQNNLQKHHMDITAATTDLLEQWKAKTHGYMEVLDKAMEKAEVGGLIPKYKEVLEGSN